MIACLDASWISRELKGTSEIKDFFAGSEEKKAEELALNVLEPIWTVLNPPTSLFVRFSFTKFDKHDRNIALDGIKSRVQ